MILDLKYYGDPVLRKKCKPVKEINDDIRQLAQDLIETVLDCDGAGLSAPQVGRLYRIFVIRYSNELDQKGLPILSSPEIYINPKISNPSSEVVSYNEGCLSIPGIYESVSRPYEITVEYMDLDGKIHKEVAINWRARVIMHENDHLNGVLFIDRIDPNLKKKIEGALRELKKKYSHLYL